MTRFGQVQCKNYPSGLALARCSGHLGIRVRVGVGSLTWRRRQSPRAVRSSRVSGPGRDKAKAQSGGAQEVAVPRSQGARGRSWAPTLPAGPSSVNSPAMARRERSSGVPTREPAPTQRGGRGRGLELHPPVGPAPPRQGPPPERSGAWGGRGSVAERRLWALPNSSALRGSNLSMGGRGIWRRARSLVPAPQRRFLG